MFGSAYYYTIQHDLLVYFVEELVRILWVLVTSKEVEKDRDIQGIRYMLAPWLEVRHWNLE